VAEVAEVDGRYASHPDRHSLPSEAQLLAALTPYGNSYGSGGGSLRAKASKNGRGRGLRARDMPGKTRANEPGRFPPPALLIFGFQPTSFLI
jgi:hypothetical protein